MVKAPIDGERVIKLKNSKKNCLVSIKEGISG